MLLILSTFIERERARGREGRRERGRKEERERELVTVLNACQILTNWSIFNLTRIQV